MYIGSEWDLAGELREMTPSITRHARNRMRLYRINAEQVETTIQRGVRTQQVPGHFVSSLAIEGRQLVVAWTTEEGNDTRVVVKTVFPRQQRSS